MLLKPKAFMTFLGLLVETGINLRLKLSGFLVLLDSLHHVLIKYFTVYRQILKKINILFIFMD
ncbi:hypothetical protein CPIN18020_0915 [Campylobacter pinnipediorum subsp. caledonicus]|nr:hypothetical protein CPIN18020_0915 [Campylobacter pinnipediorum subsp. caledonicus]